LRRDCFESLFKAEQVEMVWHGRRLFQADWGPESRSLALHLRLRGERAAEDNIFIIANTYWEDSQFELPPLQGRAWARFLDTALEPPQDICEIGGEKQLEGVESYSVGARSVVVLVGGPPTR
jgi:glycogen operon protein